MEMKLSFEVRADEKGLIISKEISYDRRIQRRNTKGKGRTNEQHICTAMHRTSHGIREIPIEACNTSESACPYLHLLSERERIIMILVYRFSVCQIRRVGRAISSTLKIDYTENSQRKKDAGG